MGELVPGHAVVMYDVLELDEWLLAGSEIGLCGVGLGHDRARATVAVSLSSSEQKHAAGDLNTQSGLHSLAERLRDSCLDFHHLGVSGQVYEKSIHRFAGEIQVYSAKHLPRRCGSHLPVHKVPERHCNYGSSDQQLYCTDCPCQQRGHAQQNAADATSPAVEEVAAVAESLDGADSDDGACLGCSAMSDNVFGCSEHLHTY